jgi:uncharacterized protein YdaU (DUF1376 family)
MGVVIPFPTRGSSSPRRMTETLSFMPWFPRDFLAATRGWSVTETGVYRALLDAQWETGDLPEDPAELRRLIGATVKEWRAGWARCELKFPIVTPGRRRNDRLEEHRQKSFRLTEMRRNGARSTNAKRWGGRSLSESHSDQPALAERVASVSHPSPSPSEEKIKNPAARAIDAGSEDLDPEAYLIWTAGIDLIGAEKRGLMGKLVKQHGQAVVAGKIAELMALAEKPRDPAAYLVGALRKLERRFVC